MPKKKEDKPVTTFVVVDSPVDGVTAGGVVEITDPVRVRQLIWGGHITEAKPEAS